MGSICSGEQAIIVLGGGRYQVAPEYYVDTSQSLFGTFTLYGGSKGKRRIANPDYRWQIENCVTLL